VQQRPSFFESSDARFPQSSKHLRIAKARRFWLIHVWHSYAFAMPGQCGETARCRADPLGAGCSWRRRAPVQKTLPTKAVSRRTAFSSLGSPSRRARAKAGTTREAMRRAYLKRAHRSSTQGHPSRSREPSSRRL
jgi:hypothetical protein